MMSNRFLLDVLARKTLVESFYVNGLETTVRLLVGHIEDSTVIENYNKGCDNGNNTELKNRLIKPSLSTGIVIFVTDCFEVCGLIVGTPCNESFSSGQHSEKLIKMQFFQLQKEYQSAKLELKMVKEFLKLAIHHSFQKIDLNETLFNDDVLKQLPQKSTFNKYLELENLDDFLVDEMPNLPEAYEISKSNNSVLKSVFAEKPGRKIDYVVAKPEDEKAIKNYMSSEYYRQTSVLRALQCPKDQLLRIVDRSNFHPLEQGIVVLALDNGKVCGLCFNRLIDVEETPSKFSQIKQVPVDFDAYIDSLPQDRHLSLRALLSFCLCMESRIKEFIDEDCKRLFRINNLSVHPNYQGCKIASTLCGEAVKIAKQNNLQYVEILATAAGTRKIAESLGMEEKIRIEYENIKYKGKRLFPDNIIYDNGTSVGMYVGKL